MLYNYEIIVSFLSGTVLFIGFNRNFNYFQNFNRDNFPKKNALVIKDEHHAFNFNFNYRLADIMVSRTK